MKARTTQIKLTNIDASLALCDSLGTSLGPRGADKIITDKKNKTIVTNDGATILKTIGANHPVLHILSSLSQTQDKECGDGTTSVVLLAGSILRQLRSFVAKGVHVSALCDALEEAKAIVTKTIMDERIEIDVDTKSSMWKAATTTLSSKVVATVSEVALTAVDAVRAVNGDLSKIKVLKKLGKGLEDISLINGCILKKPSLLPKKIAKICLLQFCLSAPKTNIDSKVILRSAEMMDAVIKEERQYILFLCKKIKTAGADIVVIQKSILRNSCSELALHFLTKMGISVVDGIDREEFEFLAENLKLRPVADPLFLSPSRVCEVSIFEEDDFLRVEAGDYVTVVVRAGDEILLDEAERSLNDALWVVKALVDEPYLVPGGGTVEVAISRALLHESTKSKFSSIFYALSRAFEIIPFMLAQNAGMDAVSTVAQLRANGGGVNVRMGCVSNMVDEEVIQPVKVSQSACSLAIETVMMILMIDDILPSVK